MNSMSNGAGAALIQKIVRPDMLGRVLTVVSSLCGAMMPLAMLIGGPVADAVGIRVLFWVGGAGQLALALIAFGLPVIMGVEDEGPESVVKAAVT